MNQSGLIETVAAEVGLTNTDATKAVQAVLSGIAAALGRGDEVRIAGFGGFEVSERAAREGRNPKTGEAVTIPAGKAVKFKAAKALRDALNG